MQINNWKKSCKIFSINYDNVDYYPAYTLNPENGYHPYKEIVDIIDAFRGNSWKLAFWFNAKNSYLGGQTPKDVIARNPKTIVEAAIIQVNGVQYG